LPNTRTLEERDPQPQPHIARVEGLALAVREDEPGAARALAMRLEFGDELPGERDDPLPGIRLRVNTLPKLRIPRPEDLQATSSAQSA
jgi:hypothetical protein